MQGRLCVVAFEDLSWPESQCASQPRTAADRIDRPSTMLILPDLSTNINIRAVQESYKQAYDRGWLSSTRIPVFCEDRALSGDPLCVSDRQDSLKAAMLDKQKVTEIVDDVGAVLKKVPSPSDWGKMAKKKSLLPHNMTEIVRLVMGEGLKGSNKDLCAEKNIEDLINSFRDHSRTLKAQECHLRHVRRLAWLVDGLLMRVHEFVWGDNRTASTAVRDHTHGLATLRTDDARLTLP